MAISLTPPTHMPIPQTRDALFKVAQDLEATFISEMLKSSGFGESQNSFSGGSGEDQFASFLRDEHSKLMVNIGGIGLAEHIFNALITRHAAD